MHTTPSIVSGFIINVKNHRLKGFGKHIFFQTIGFFFFFLLPVCGKYLLKRKSLFVRMIYSAVFSLLFKPTHPVCMCVCVCDFLCGARSRFCTQKKKNYDERMFGLPFCAGQEKLWNMCLQWKRPSYFQITHTQSWRHRPTNMHDKSEIKAHSVDWPRVAALGWWSWCNSWHWTDSVTFFPWKNVR